MESATSCSSQQLWQSHLLGSCCFHLESLELPQRNQKWIAVRHLQNVPQVSALSHSFIQLLLGEMGSLWDDNAAVGTTQREEPNRGLIEHLKPEREIERLVQFPALKIGEHT